MKAERRHELRTNTLAHGLGNVPVFWQRYGTKIMLGLLAVLAIVLVVRFQQRTAREQQAATADSYAAALQGIDNIQGLVRISDPRAAASQRKELQQTAERALQQVLEDSKSDALKADAWVARGDLNWHLARSPDVPGAATQPSLKLAENDNELLDKAQRAYEAAAKASGARPVTVTMARLGIAAVAEQRAQWDAAKAAYQAMIDDKSTPDAFRGEAKVRLDDLATIQKPVLIGKPTTEPAIGGPDASVPVGPQAPTTGAQVPATGATTTTTSSAATTGGATTGPTTAPATTVPSTAPVGAKPQAAEAPASTPVEPEAPKR